MEKDIFYVYRFVDKAGKILYVGRTSNIYSRLKSHQNNGHLNRVCYEQVNKVEYAELESITDAQIYELYLINKLDPQFNVMDARNDKLSFELPNLNWIETTFGNVERDYSDFSLDDLMGVEDASKVWGLAAGYIKDLCAKGKIEATKIGKTWIIYKKQSNPKEAKK